MGLAVKRPKYEQALVGCSGELGRLPKGLLGQSGWENFKVKFRELLFLHP